MNAVRLCSFSFLNCKRKIC